MKKTVLIISNLSGGLVLFRIELINALIQKYNIVIMADDSGFERTRELRDMGCEVITTKIDRRGINPFADLNLFFNYWKTIKKIKPSIVLTYTIKPNIYGGLVCRIQRIPYAANITGLGTAFEKKGILKNFVSLLYKASLNKAKVVFFENKENSKVFIKESLISKEQAKVLNGAGVNTDRFPYLQYPSDNNEFIFLYIGRIMREKGIDELFNALEKIRDVHDNVYLHILGGMDENYQAQIECYESKGWIKYYGYQNDVRPYIARANCIVLPSWHEGMANTNLEAASCGRPLITSNIPGCQEAVQDGINGLLFEVKNVESLSEAMMKMVGMNNREREEMGRAGREYMKKRFEKKKVVTETIAALDIG